RSGGCRSVPGSCFKLLFGGDGAGDGVFFGFFLLLFDKDDVLFAVVLGNQFRRRQRQVAAVQAGGQVAVLLHRQADVEEAVHRRQEAVDAVAVLGEAQLGQAADDLLFQFVLGGDFGLQEQVAVLVQQCRQFVTTQAAAVEHGQRVAALV